jgi:hypothetical protein
MIVKSPVVVKRIEVYYIYTYENSIMNFIKHCLKRWEKKRGEHVQGAPYTCTALS